MTDDRKYPASFKGLMKFCMENTKAEDPTTESGFEPMSEEKKQWLKEAFDAINQNNPVKKMVENINVILKSLNEVSLEGKQDALEDITAYCEEIDLANDFHKIGGFEILSDLLNDGHAILRGGAAELIATLAQNNPYCQEKLLDTNEIFPLLLKKLSEEKETNEVKIKCLYAISCMSRESVRAQEELFRLEGFNVLMKLLCSDVEKLRNKSVFLIGSLCVESNKVKDLLYKRGIIAELVDLLSQGPHTPTHELITQALLNMVQDYPPAQMECQKPSYKLEEIILRRKKQLGDDESHQDEVEKLNELMKICFS